MIEFITTNKNIMLHPTIVGAPMPRFLTSGNYLNNDSRIVRWAYIIEDNKVIEMYGISFDVKNRSLYGWKIKSLK